MYIGALFVPLEIKPILLNKLLDMRCIQNNSWTWDEYNCPFNCGYHKMNNTEIHYNELHRSNARYRIACRWLDDFLIKENNKRNKKLVYFSILGLNLTNMNLEFFGPKKGRSLMIYNRFFRTILKTVDFFFAEYNKKIIKTIFHDKGSQKFHDYIPWHPGKSINEEAESNVQVENEEIVFIDSDHREYPNINGDFREESQFIQFIDLILGSVYCCLHNPTKDEKKRRVGLIMKPLLWRLLKRPKNINSSYNYYRKQEVSFFPRTKAIDKNENLQQIDISGNVLQQQNNNFYKNRPILLEDDENQTRLDDFI
jgi:hypothetical protein